eukprot:TRINITY_DN10458_c0_g1_i1.p1 TRINITY_DN10458_c0_g1~~TRINITY_DN10458_c0_g1_i1.p1  ORF type:complete len:355 (+),score=35.13 TRINITY_DN10458_c0_g1_i1:45-1067(+)
MALQSKVDALKEALDKQEQKHAIEIKKFESELSDLRRLVHDLEENQKRLDCVGKIDSSDQFVRRVEWTISNFSKEEKLCQKGTPMWSPKFKAAGLEGLKLEFIPKGREKSSPGFCSLFLWCPNGTHIRYQLWVGSFLRSPDHDEYAGDIGHGHSNFCPLEPQVDRENDSIRVGVDFLEVIRSHTFIEKGLTLTSSSLQQMVSKEAEVVHNRGVNRVVWKIHKISEMLKLYPRGASMYSRTFTANGIREIHFEFYPNGSTDTKKDGYCAFYLKCSEGSSMIVTLFVGNFKKGPIKTTYDSLTAKGLPDFCLLQDEINREDDSIEVGIEVQNRPSKVLSLVS